MSRFISAIHDLFASWFQADRIRVSPTTGRLLSLQRGDRFIFRGEAFVVTDRRPLATESELSVEYHLDSSNGGYRLKVAQSETKVASQGLLSHAQGCEVVFDDDVTILRADLGSMTPRLIEVPFH